MEILIIADMIESLLSAGTDFWVAHKRNGPLLLGLRILDCLAEVNNYRIGIFNSFFSFSD